MVLVSLCLLTSPPLPQSQTFPGELSLEKHTHSVAQMAKKKKQVKLAFGEKFLWKKTICSLRAK